MGIRFDIRILTLGVALLVSLSPQAASPESDLAIGYHAEGVVSLKALRHDFQQSFTFSIWFSDDNWTLTLLPVSESFIYESMESGYHDGVIYSLHRDRQDRVGISMLKSPVPTPGVWRAFPVTWLAFANADYLNSHVISNGVMPFTFLDGDHQGRIDPEYAEGSVHLLKRFLLTTETEHSTTIQVFFERHSIPTETETDCLGQSFTMEFSETLPDQAGLRPYLRYTGHVTNYSAVKAQRFTLPTPPDDREISVADRRYGNVTRPYSVRMNTEGRWPSEEEIAPLIAAQIGHRPPNLKWVSIILLALPLAGLYFALSKRRSKMKRTTTTK
jgi:hypothetical protein